MTEEEEYTEHAEECLKLLEEHKFVTVGDGEFQVNNKFLHTLLYTATQNLLAENHSWIVINEEIMNTLEVPAIHHDNFIFAVNSLIGTILEQQPDILLLGKVGTQDERRVAKSAGEMVLAGYNELSRGIFHNMNAYK